MTYRLPMFLAALWVALCAALMAGAVHYLTPMLAYAG
jgi:hypothetical protein